MSKVDYSLGLSELRETKRQFRALFWSAAFFSVFLNILMLTGPLFMLQTYDRVLGSRSEETLVALFAIVAFLFLTMGLVDWARGRVLTRMGANFQAKLDRRVFEAMIKKTSMDQDLDQQALRGNQLKDLEAIQRYYSSPVFSALFDAPWAPIYMVGISLFHPWLGLAAVAGGSVLILSAIFNQLTTKVSSVKAAAAGYMSERYSDLVQNEAETIRSLGMQSNAFRQWTKMRQRSLQQSVRSSDLGGSFLTLSKTFRLFLQSSMLALGAFLVLRGEVTPGVMIASSILLGRALAPVETVVNQWSVVQRARRGWDNLVTLLSEVREDRVQVELPRPRSRLEIKNITVVPPEGHQATLRQITFNVMPGEAVGVIGPSGSGKSTLARSITGIWPLAGGKIFLDGAPLDQYHPERLAQYIGYLPQRVTLFDGTIAENIARLATDFDDEKVIGAAKKAAAHELILTMPKGYNTPIRTIGTQLSGGQVQRIGLARALYGDPVLLVLDEPNSNLDNEGSIALNRAVIAMKQAGNSILIMAHRPSAIKECDKLLMLENGVRAAWGPREKVMSEMLANVRVIQKTKKTVGGVA
ncbi:type I secretion system permease/ATPase [Antarcticimicrobium sediminis]|uniref:Type I secretion system permease/ATPase n=2 Tax=Antarcticimicrobium sediminis TaxID=2546227 RepID=A0A4R5F014_9RHOB|nr:type I secretion system permease/ATPase [Antarcticimicrobium sediminis]TDE40673.1 type I secretion system permease/ATPase [Antarcticimicrobium sediminis]